MFLSSADPVSRWRSHAFCDWPGDTLLLGIGINKLRRKLESYAIELAWLSAKNDYPRIAHFLITS
jgi:hypothetical protein